MTLDDRCGPPVLARSDIPDPSSCGHTVRRCPRPAEESVPVVVCSTAGRCRISAWCVRGHGMISGRPVDFGLHGKGAGPQMGQSKVFFPTTARVDGRRGMPGESVPGTVPMATVRAVLCGFECAPSPLPGDWTHSDRIVRPFCTYIRKICRVRWSYPGVISLNGGKMRKDVSRISDPRAPPVSYTL